MNNHIAKLSDEMLVEKLVALSKKETEVTADILFHLVELEKRRLYRDQGYTSLYAYCIGRLAYSPCAAKRRIVAARCIAKYPEVYRMFLRKDVSLTTISIFAPVLTEENHELILSQVCGKTPAEVELIVARFNPSRPSFDRIVPVFVPSNQVEQNGVTASPKNLEFHLGSREPQLNCRDIASDALSLEVNYRFEFSTSKEFKEKLDRVKMLASGKLGPGAKLENVLELALDEYITRHAPEHREERRKARERRMHKERELRVIRKQLKQPSRGVASRTRDQVFLRDGFKCTFISSDGVPCQATHGLHLDHIIPKGLGGPNSLENLRLLCGPHNRLVAEQEFGKPFMQQFY